MNERLFTSALHGASAFFFALLLILLTIAVFRWLLSVHWSMGLILLIFYGYAVYIGLIDFRSDRLTLRQGIGASTLLLLLSLLLFATVSFMLEAVGWAEHRGIEEEPFLTLVAHYGWLLLDAIPVVKGPEALKWQDPVETVGVSAGLPVLAFRAFVIWVVLAAIRDWWRRREDRVGVAIVSDDATSGDEVPGPSRHLLRWAAAVGILMMALWDRRRRRRRFHSSRQAAE